VKARRGKASVPKESKTRRVLSSLLRIVLTSASIVALGLIGIDGYSFLTTSDRFALSGVEIAGCDEQRKEEALRQADIEVGCNIWSIDVSQVAERIRRLGWVRQVTVEKTLPNHVRILIAERRAVAIMEMINGELMGLDQEGMPLPLLERERESLPMLEGLDISAVRLGTRVGEQCHSELLDLLEEMAATTPEMNHRFPLVSLDSGGNVALRDLTWVKEVRLGRKNLAATFNHFVESMSAIEKLGHKYEYLDLRFPRQGIVARPVEYNALEWLNRSRHQSSDESLVALLEGGEAEDTE
jgi:cell division septal protein FtsQ